MAGTITFAGSQQLDKYAKPLSGGKVWIIKAGTTSDPQNAFYDSALTQPLPYPIELDAAGRVPYFFLDDGFVKVRITDANGVQQFNQDGILVVGPSTGGGGGGGGVDPTTVFQTGDVMWLDVQGTRTGWVRDNGRTIGSATSGGTERANSDCQALFVWLWGKYDNTICPVSGGRGVSAAADWSADKTIQTPNKRNASSGGLDDMGNTAAGGYANVPVVVGGVTTAGSIIGENLHQLTVGELAQHDHSVFLHDPGHTNPYDKSKAVPGVQPGGGGASYNSFDTVPSGSAMTGITLWSDGDNSGTQNKVGKTGSGTAHNTVQRTVLGTFYRKL